MHPITVCYFRPQSGVTVLVPRVSMDHSIQLLIPEMGLNINNSPLPLVPLGAEPIVTQACPLAR